MKKSIYILWVIVIMMIMNVLSFGEPLNTTKTYWVHLYDEYTKGEIWLESNYQIKITDNKSNMFVNDGTMVLYKKLDSSGTWVLEGTSVKSTWVGLNLEGSYLISSSHDIYNESGEIAFGIPIADVRILLPSDGFEDNSWIFTFWVDAIVTYVSDVSNIDIEIRANDVSISSYEVTRNYGVWKDGDYYHNLNFNIELPVGENIVSVKYKVADEVIGEKSITVTRLEGFIDADGDGLDDRTGRTDINIKPIDWSGDLTNIENTDFLGAAKNLTGQVGQLPLLVSSVLSFLPREVLTIMVAGFGAVVLIAIFRAIRGG
jgi:hypothetical protein